MKIRFKKSTHLDEYHGFHEAGRVDFLDSEIKDIPEEKAIKLLEDFPDNFLLTKELAEPPEDKMIRKQEIKPGKKRRTPKFKKIE